MGIEEHVAVKCPCCDAVDVDTRHARICLRAGAQVNQHQPLLHAISRTPKRLGFPRQVESDEPFTADKNLRIDIVVRRGDLRDAPNRVHSAGRHPCRPTRAGTPARRQLVLTTMDQLLLPPRHTSANTTFVRYTHVFFAERSHELATLAVESFGEPRGRG